MRQSRQSPTPGGCGYRPARTGRHNRRYPPRLSRAEWEESAATTEFHDWDDIRAELDDDEHPALAIERARTEMWASARNLADERPHEVQSEDAG